MMGERATAQGALFYGFNLERHVPADHLLRSIDRFVDLGDLRKCLRPFYSETGRPSIDPELMIRFCHISRHIGAAGSAGSAFLGLPLDGTTGLIAMNCIGCSSAAVTERPDLTAHGYRRFRCRDCGKPFNERSDGACHV